MARSEVNQGVAWMFALSLSVNVFGGGYFYLTHRSVAKDAHDEHGSEDAENTHQEHGADQAEHSESSEHAAPHNEHGAAIGHENSEHAATPAHEKSAAAKHDKTVAIGHHQPHWSYEGEIGPTAWGELDQSFKTCDEGRAQSPINLKKSAAKTGHETLEFHYKTSDVQLTNNGHTIQANYGAGNYMTYKGQRYDLAQFHFHNPSEHHFDGKTKPLEVHLVHKNKQGDLAVVGVAFAPQGTNQTLAQLWAHLPKKSGQIVPIKQFDVQDFLPQDRAFYHYAGSLTTPPCSEGVKWFVMRDTSIVSGAQLAVFNKLFPLNARPVQPLNGRSVSNNGGASEFAH